MKLYFKRGVMSGFIITILTISGLGIYSYVTNRELVEGSIIQSRSLLITTSAEKVLTTMLDLETSQRGYVITGDPIYLEPYESAIQSIDANLELLTKVTASYDDKRQKVDQVKRLAARKMDFVTKTIAARAYGFEEAQAKIVSGEGKRIMDSIRLIIGEIHSVETDVYNMEAAQSEKQLDSSGYIFTFALIVPAVTVIVLFITINSHLNKREEAKNRLQKANEDVMKINRELESFTYSVSHDLRAPLRSVNGYANVLLEDYGDQLDEDAKRTINVIARNGQRMGELIDDLLDFSRLGRKDIVKTTVSMEATVHQVIDEIRETKRYPGKVAIEIGTLPDVNADPSMIRQVWYNLISNGIKYSGKTLNPAIEIGSFIKSDHVCYYVKDNGVGFDMAYVNKLFGIFQRLHKQNEFEGTGVGLALVKRIIDRHNGQVWAEGEIGQGAKFYFSLPN